MAEYVSTGAAQESTGTSQDEINRCCIRARNAYSANGYIWKRKCDETPIEVWVEANKKKFGRHAVAKYNLHGELLETYISVAEANRKNGYGTKSR